MICEVLAPDCFARPILADTAVLLARQAMKPATECTWFSLPQILLCCRYGRKSWKPWLFSLAVDVVSGHLSNVGAKVAQREIKSDDVKPGLSTSGSMLLLYSLQAFK